MTDGPTARLLTPVLTSGDDSVLDLLPALRAALSGSGPALLLPAPGAGFGAERPRSPDNSGAVSGDAMPIDPQNDPPNDPPIELSRLDDDPADPTAVAVTTSGSSGAAKTVLLSASALLASAGATHDRLGGAGRWLLALPAQHIAGVQILVRSLIAGTRPAVLDLSAGFTPEGFIEAADRLGGLRRYTALVPTQLTRLLTAPGQVGTRATEALRRFDAVLVGGAATTAVLHEQAVAAGVRLVSTYGMSETCGGCVYDGVPLDGVTYRLDGAEGRVLLGGPVLARGYLFPRDHAPGRRPARADDAGTAGTGPVPAFSTDASGRRWFRTDDAGILRDGKLQILGRLDSIIITGGINVAPGPIEVALQRLPGVAEAVVVGLPDPEWGHRVAAALVLVPGARPPTLAAARAQVSAEVSAQAAPRQLTILDALPLRGPGKPDRTAIEKALTERPPLEGH